MENKIICHKDDIYCKQLQIMADKIDKLEARVETQETISRNVDWKIEKMQEEIGSINIELIWK